MLKTEKVEGIGANYRILSDEGFSDEEFEKLECIKRPEERKTPTKLSQIEENVIEIYEIFWPTLYGLSIISWLDFVYTLTRADPVTAAKVYGYMQPPFSAALPLLFFLLKMLERKTKNPLLKKILEHLNHFIHNLDNFPSATVLILGIMSAFILYYAVLENDDEYTQVDVNDGITSSVIIGATSISGVLTLAVLFDLYNRIANGFMWLAKKLPNTPLYWPLKILFWTLTGAFKIFEVLCKAGLDFVAIVGAGIVFINFVTLLGGFERTEDPVHWFRAGVVPDLVVGAVFTLLILGLRVFTISMNWIMDNVIRFFFHNNPFINLKQNALLNFFNKLLLVTGVIVNINRIGAINLQLLTEDIRTWPEEEGTAFKHAMIILSAIIIGILLLIPAILSIGPIYTIGRLLFSKDEAIPEQESIAKNGLDRSNFAPALRQPLLESGQQDIEKSLRLSFFGSSGSQQQATKVAKASTEGEKEMIEVSSLDDPAEHPKSFSEAKTHQGWWQSCLGYYSWTREFFRSSTSLEQATEEKGLLDGREKEAPTEAKQETTPGLYSGLTPDNGV